MSDNELPAACMVTSVARSDMVPGGTVLFPKLQNCNFQTNKVFFCRNFCLLILPVLKEARLSGVQERYYMFSGISCVAYAISHPSYSVLRPNPQQNPPLQDAVLISNRSLQNALSKTRWANSSRPLPNRMPISMLTTHWFSTCQTSLNYKSFTTSLPFHREIARIHRFVASTSSPIMKWNFQEGCFPGFCMYPFLGLRQRCLNSAPSSVPTWEMIWMDRQTWTMLWGPKNWCSKTLVGKNYLLNDKKTWNTYINTRSDR